MPVAIKSNSLVQYKKTVYFVIDILPEVVTLVINSHRDIIKILINILSGIRISDYNDIFIICAILAGCMIVSSYTFDVSLHPTGNI